jgi:hypothetical protein
MKLQRHLQRGTACLCALVVCLLTAWSRPAAAQQIWEYSPYRVQVWLSLDPSLDTSATAQEIFATRLAHQLEATFGAAWSVELRAAPADMEALIRRQLDQLTTADLASQEFVLVLSKDDPATSTLRVFGAAVERLEKIAITAADRRRLLRAAQFSLEDQAATGTPEQADTAEDSVISTLLEKARDEASSVEELLRRFEAKEINAALVARADVERFAAWTRPIQAALPWQTEHLYRELDKVFIVHCDFDGDHYRVRARELDCGMRHFGPTITRHTPLWSMFSGLGTQAVVAAFAPVARVEEAELRSAILKMRSGGLILDEGNPAAILPGDVLQPIVRRDDRNGIPTLLQALPWTYVAITASNGIDMRGNVYSGIGGALQGKGNRRTQRVALRVRPEGLVSEVQVVEKTAGLTPQPGCDIYARDLATEELRFLGRTDWRGILSLSVPDAPVEILPEAERKRRADAKRAAEEAAALASAQAAEAELARGREDAADNSSSAATTAPGNSPAGATPTSVAARGTANAPANADGGADEAGPGEGADSASAEPDLSTAEGRLAQVETADPVRLRQPMVQIFIRSGSNTLARLPIIPGLNAREVAELPSDARRLEAEALVQGFQGEILDLIGRRTLLAARVHSRIADGKLDEATQLMVEMRNLETYNDMADALEAIQRRLLDESRGAVPQAAKNRIDRMIQSTRDTMQKYLQNDLVRKLEIELRNASGPKPSPGQPEATVPPPEAADGSTATASAQPVTS